MNSTPSTSKRQESKHPYATGGAAAGGNSKTPEASKPGGMTKLENPSQLMKTPMASVLKGAGSGLDLRSSPVVKAVQDHVREYTREEVIEKLPSWMQRKLKAMSSFDVKGDMVEQADNALDMYKACNVARKVMGYDDPMILLAEKSELAYHRVFYLLAVAGEDEDGAAVPPAAA